MPTFMLSLRNARLNDAYRGYLRSDHYQHVDSDSLCATRVNHIKYALNREFLEMIPCRAASDNDALVGRFNLQRLNSPAGSLHDSIPNSLFEICQPWQSRLHCDHGSISRTANSHRCWLCPRRLSSISQNSLSSPTRTV